MHTARLSLGNRNRNRVIQSIIGYAVCGDKKAEIGQQLYKGEIMRNFDERLDNWLAMVQGKLDAYFKGDSQTPVLVAIRGRKYVKIIKIHWDQRTVFAFINTDNGDILKPASWSAPARHARGNLFDENDGIKYVGPYGPAYLK
jgi:hypothetical protein